MIKKIMAITIAIAFILAQTGVAQAVFEVNQHYSLTQAADDPADPYATDPNGPAFIAEADFTGADIVATLTVSLLAAADNSGADQIDWLAVTLTDNEWRKSDQYLVVEYEATTPDWGIQMYTDNTHADADPKYSGDPTSNTQHNPAGLIGEVGTGTAIPMALLVADELPVDDPADPSDHWYDYIQEPIEEVGFGRFNSGIDTDSDPTTGDEETGAEVLWFFLTDRAETYFVDYNEDGYLTLENPDPEGDPYVYGQPEYEIYPKFDPNGDGMATILNEKGAATGVLGLHSSGRFYVQNDDWRNRTAVSPVYVFIAADFGQAKSAQRFRTNTLSIELYHQ
jgi:hypothetical protein